MNEVHTSCVHLGRTRAFGSAQESLRDHDTLHLVGAFVDLGDLGVAHEAFHRELLGESVATEDLHCVSGHRHRRVAGE